MADEFPTIISFSWGKKKYHDAAARLRKQCEKYGYPHSIVRPDLRKHMKRQFNPEWREKYWVTRAIPGFILDEMELLDTDVLLLHCDLEIQKPIPPEAWEGLDIGLEEQWCTTPPRPGSVLGFPVFVRNNERARRFVRLWNALCMNVDDGGCEHDYLRWTYRKMKKDDRTLKIDVFTPRIASVQADATTPIRGDKVGR